MTPITSASGFRLAKAVRSLGIDPVLKDGTGISFRVARDTQVPVAAWVYAVKTGNIEIWVNENVLECVTDIELQALLIHELLHHLIFNQHRRLRKLFGKDQAADGASLHARTDRVVALTTNLAFDWAIERLLLRGPLADGVRQLSRRYRLAQLPAEGPVPLATQLMLLTASETPVESLDRVADVYRFLWSTDVPAPPEVAFQLILPLATELASDSVAFKALAVTYDGVVSDEKGVFVIRGLPADDEPGKTIRSRSPQVPEAFADALRQFTQSSAGDSGWLDDLIVSPAAISKQRAHVLSQWLARAPAEHSVQRCLQIVAGDLLESRQERKPYLSKPTRQELVRFALGFPSLTWNNRVGSSSRLLATYVDTSGSMLHRRGIALALLKALQDQLPATIFLFSDSIERTDLRRLLSGVWREGGGTSFDAVVRHAIQNRFRNAVVFTDGEGMVSPDLQLEMRRRRLNLRAVIFDNYYDQETQPWWAWPHVFHWGVPPRSDDFGGDAGDSF